MQAGRLLTFGAAVMLGAVALLAWALSPAATAGPCAVAAGPALLPDLPEASGLAVSRRHPGVLWSHNDSGSAAVLFALDATGAPRGREFTFRRIGQLGLAAVTDAEASRDGASVVVRTSHEAVLYRTGDLVLGRTAPQMRIPIDGLRELQGEGVALDGSTLYLASEGKPWSRAGRLVSLSCRLPQ